MLLSQQAQLVRLDDHRAVVQVAGTWMAMVQTRLALVEQAITRALGSPRQLVLEASKEPPPSVPSPPQLPQVRRAPTPPAAPAPQPPTEPPALPAPPTRAAAPPAPPAPQASRLDEKAKRLAEFFNGEVIELDEPLEEVNGIDAA
jgi:DNA polymerase-3 subunit gamma/tau